MDRTRNGEELHFHSPAFICLWGCTGELSICGIYVCLLPLLLHATSLHILDTYTKYHTCMMPSDLCHNTPTLFAVMSHHMGLAAGQISCAKRTTYADKSCRLSTITVQHRCHLSDLLVVPVWCQTRYAIAVQPWLHQTLYTLLPVARGLRLMHMQQLLTLMHGKPRSCRILHCPNTRRMLMLPCLRWVLLLLHHLQWLLRH